MSPRSTEKHSPSAQTATRPNGTPRILVGMGTCGIAAGAEEILGVLEERLNGNGLEAEIVQVGCIGLCYAEPLVEIVKPGRPSVFYGNLTPDLMSQIIED